MKIYRYLAHTPQSVTGSVQAVEVARFPSGNAFLRWFDDNNEKINFDLVGNPDADEVKNMDPLIGFKLNFVGQTLTHLTYNGEPDVYDIGMLPSHYEEAKWFARYLGAPLGLQKGRKKRGWRNAGRVKWKEVGETPASHLAVSQEELELYQMIGEPMPLLWSDAPFAEWAEEHFGRG